MKDFQLRKWSPESKWRVQGSSKKDIRHLLPCGGSEKTLKKDKRTSRTPVGDNRIKASSGSDGKTLHSQGNNTVSKERGNFLLLCETTSACVDVGTKGPSL